MARDAWGTYISPKDFEDAKSRGICEGTVISRIVLGWKAKDAISIPVRKTSEEYKKCKRLAILNGIKEGTYRSRVRGGWKPYEAATQELGKRRRENNGR